jgi:hypothetical protein
MTSPLFKTTTVPLLFIGFLTLFLELTFIRWMPSNVFALAYFSNTVLIASFLGLGLGMLLAEKKRDLFVWLPLCLLAVGVLSTLFRFVFVFLVPTSTDVLWNTVYIDNWFRFITVRMGMWQVLTAAFVLSAAPFVLIGQKTARLMAGIAPLKAYGLQVLGSVLGVCGFALLSFAGPSFGNPTVWFVLVGGIVAVLLYGHRVAFIAAIVCTLAFPVYLRQLPDPETWSPYYAINSYFDVDTQSTYVYVNRFLHQTVYNVETNALAQNAFGIPYAFANPKRVLVLGAGNGNDVAAALQHGAEHVDAVELDPVIAEIGKTTHPNRPYADPRVTLTIGDARSFLEHSTETYDLIVFGTLDSHVLVSGMSTARMESFVYTADAFQAAKDHLAPDGVVAVLFSVPESWLADKIMKTALTVFDDPKPLVYAGGDAPVLFNLAILAGPGVGTISDAQLAASNFRVIAGSTVDDANVPTDDWPYMYLLQRGIPSHYVKAVGILFLLSLFGISVVSGKAMTRWGTWENANFFCLGAAFLLLETKSITTLSLVFSSTWLVNAFVFSGILLMVLGANYFMSNVDVRRIWPWYLGLGIALVVNYCIPVSAYLSLGDGLRYVVPALMTSLPLFFSAVIFSFHVRGVKDLGIVLGVNLLGAVLGGFLEYTSMMIGFQFLYILAAFLYGGSFLAYWRGRMSELPSQNIG